MTNSSINTDSIVKKIKQEIEERKKNGLIDQAIKFEDTKNYNDFYTNNSITYENPTKEKTSFIWKIGDHIDRKLNTPWITKFFIFMGEKISILIPRNKTYLNLNDLLKYHDSEFILNTYIGILGRNPDAYGSSHYLTRLRNGDCDKIDIILELRQSPEGKKRNIVIRNLFLHRIIKFCYKIPIIGYLIKLTLYTIRLPILIKNISSFEAYSHSTSTKFKENLKHIANTSDEKFNNISEQLSNKVGVEFLDVIKSQIDKKEDKSSPDQSSNTFYVAFENRFRGTRSEIREKLKIYLPYLSNKKDLFEKHPFLDIGCGRGEWLELLKDENIPIMGIDINLAMVKECEALNLNAKQADLTEFINSQDPEKFGGISSFHVVEHLSLDILLKFLTEAYRILNKGGMLILETPNPENLVVAACNFHIDPTHKNPIPPPTLKFLVENAGFEVKEILRLHPATFYDELEMKGAEKLKHLFNNEQDYAIIAFKP